MPDSTCVRVLRFISFVCSLTCEYYVRARAFAYVHALPGVYLFIYSFLRVSVHALV